MKSKLGFIGLGTMGAPMALRLIAGGYSLVVCDKSARASSELAAAKAHVVATPAEVASEAEIVFVCLPSPAAVHEVALGANGICEGNTAKTYVDMSTTGSRMAKTIAGKLADYGIASVDAPVSGGVAGARKGTLTIMVSGDSDSFDRIRPLLTLMGEKIFFVGESAGNAQTVKVINNLLAATAMVASCEAMVMGVKAGLDPKMLLEVINSGSGRNMATADKFPRAILPRTFDIGFKTRLMYKDVSLCLEEAELLGVPMWVANSVKQLCGFAAVQGHPDEDFTEIIKYMERWAGVEVCSKTPNLAA